LFGGPSKDNAAEEKKKRADIQPNPFAAVPTKAQQTNTNAAELLDSFMQGLGIERADMHPSTDPHEILENAGRVLSEFVDGISELLASRSTMKSMFRLDQTTVLPRHKTLFYIQVS
jgi:predicted component of type VI protein secretion system